MKHNLFFLAAFLLSLWLAPSAGAQTFSYHIAQGQDVTFRVNDDDTTVALIGYTQCAGHLVIPTTVTNSGITYTVTYVGDEAFANCSTLTAVTIPGSITYIGNSAFACPSLTTVNYNAISAYSWTSPTPFVYYSYHYDSNGNEVYDTVRAPIAALNIGSNVRRIPEYLMYGISTLTTLTIPVSVDTIGVCAFCGAGLTTLTIPANVKEIGGGAFMCPSLATVNYNAISAKTYTSSYSSSPSLPSPFVSCNSHYDSHWNTVYDTVRAPITTLNIGSNVRTIPDYLMDGISTLASLTIPVSVDTIGVRAFCGTGLTALTIPVNVKAIGSGAFMCPNLATVNYNAISAETFTSSSSGQSAPIFVSFYCDYDDDYNYVCDTVRAPITALNIGSNVRKIPGSLMDGVSTLTVVNNIPSTVDTIGAYAFYGTGITSITIPDSVKYIGRCAFVCPNLATVNYNAVNCFADAYDYYSGLNGIFRYIDGYNSDTVRAPIATLNIGNGVRNISEYFMADIPTLTTLTIPVSVSSIGNRAFACPNLSTVHYNARRAVVYNRNNYNNYDGYIFATAPVSNLTIGDSVECIPYNFLYGDTLLTSVTIPASVDTIGHQAFYGTGLTTLTIPVSVKAIGNRAFMCPYLTTLHYNARRIDPDYDNGTNNIFGGYIEDYYYEDYYYYYWIVPVANLTIGDSVEFVPYNFLYRDTLLTSVSLPASVRHIGGNAFCDTRLTSVTIPANMDTIGSNAFSMPTLASVHYNATNLQEAGSESYSPFSNGDGVPQTLTIGSNVRTLPEGVFGYMKISSVTLPDSLQSIGDHCFQNTRLTSVTIPDYVSGIGGWAFASYDVDGTSFSGAMRRVVIGSRVSSIGNYAFAGITNPDTIFVRATVPPTIVAHTFEAMPTNAAIILPCGTTQSYQNASYWNSFSRMGEDPSCYNLITVQANNATMGSVSGGGRYSTGNIATLSAMPRNNHAFVGWVDGSVDNPRLVLVSGDASYTANFAPSSGGIVHDTVTHTDTVVIDHHDTVFVGGTDTIYIYDTVYIHDTVFIHHRDTVNIVGYDDIRGISGQTEVLLYSNGGKIVVEGADGMPVRVYDSVGRLLSIRKENTGVVWFDVPASGTYLVRVGDYPARRIVVIR